MRWPTRDRSVVECRGANLERLRGYKESLRLADRWVPTAMPVCAGWEANGPNVFFSTLAVWVGDVVDPSPLSKTGAVAAQEL